jgi:hypothetical protein
MSNFKLILLPLILAIIYLGGCSKSPAANSPATSGIVGTWNNSSERDIYKTGNTTTQDTSYSIPAGESRITYTAGGQYTNYESGVQNSTGSYTLSGSSLIQINTQNPAGIHDSVITLNAHSLVVTHSDTAYAASPVSITQNIFSFTR